MHPAPSVILFTTLSGLGFGLLAWLGFGFPVVTGWTAFWFFLVGFGLAVAGLLFSTLHLGRPERAIKAFSQWRTSWLSREAWMSMAALSVMGLYAIGAIFFGVRIALLGWIGAALSLTTVLTTSMIYAQLKTVPRWNHFSTPVLFVVLAITGGALLGGYGALASVLLVLSGGLQLLFWHFGDQRFSARGSSLGTASGLGTIGAVRQFAPPHTGTSYLTREMVFLLGRKHQKTLRVIGVLLMSILPALLLSTNGGPVALGVSAILHLLGVLTIRWLFFAQAEHVVGLYYGAHN